MQFKNGPKQRTIRVVPCGKMIIPRRTGRLSQGRNGRFAGPTKRWTNIEKNAAAETQQLRLGVPAFLALLMGIATSKKER